MSSGAQCAYNRRAFAARSHRHSHVCDGGRPTNPRTDHLCCIPQAVHLGSSPGTGRSQWPAGVRAEHLSGGGGNEGVGGGPDRDRDRDRRCGHRPVGACLESPGRSALRRAVSRHGLAAMCTGNMPAFAIGLERGRNQPRCPATAGCGHAYDNGPRTTRSRPVRVVASAGPLGLPSGG